MDNREQQEQQYQSALNQGAIWYRKALDALSTTPHGLDEFAGDDDRKRAQNEAAGSALRQALKYIGSAAFYAERLEEPAPSFEDVLLRAIDQY